MSEVRTELEPADVPVDEMFRLRCPEGLALQTVDLRLHKGHPGGQVIYVTNRWLTIPEAEATVAFKALTRDPTARVAGVRVWLWLVLACAMACGFMLFRRGRAG